jgi:hypothetical protein
MQLKSGLVIIITGFLLFACGNKKKPSLSGEDPVEIGDFIESFSPVDLPYSIVDGAVAKKSADSLLISYKVFTQFVPDSVLGKVFGKNTKIKIYPLGRVADQSKGNYLFLKAISNEKRSAFVIYFDRKDHFITGMSVLQPDASSATLQSFTMDKRFTISKTVTRKNPDGSTSDGKDVYALNNSAKSFILIMTDALDVKIDTLAKKNKFSGDYAKDKNNLVSIRDSKRAGRLTFFVHFERNNGSCTGELKGEAGITSANTAVYRASGEPCVLQFNFTSSSVSLKEVGGCGSHRGIDCLFEGYFPKKKEPKAVKKTTGKK